MAARPVLADEPRYGLIVEYVTPGSPAAFSGFQHGDLLLGWELRPRDPMMGPVRTGTLDTSFDLAELFVEGLPRGELTFECVRHGQSLLLTYRSTGGLALGLGVQPVSAAGKYVPAGSPRRTAWLRIRAAENAALVGDTEAAGHLFGKASEILLQASDPSARAAVLVLWAHYLDIWGEPARAQAMYDEALASVSRRQEGGLWASHILGLLAHRADRQGDLAASERILLERLVFLEDLAPASLETARSLNVLGYLALWRWDIAAAEERLNRSEALQRPLGTDTYLYAGTLNHLAILAELLGDLERAEALQRQALSLLEHWVPGSPEYGGYLMNLAGTVAQRGDLAQAEDLLRQSAKLVDQPGTHPRGVVGPYVNLGQLALYRGDLAAARSYFEPALSHLRTIPDSVELAEVYGHLATIARKQQRFAEARTWEESALAIKERLVLGGLGRAARLETLARLEQEAGNLAAAEALLRQAEAIVLETAPEGSAAVTIRRDLGRLLVQTGRPSEAEALYRRILSSLERRGLTGSREENEILNLLGHAQRRRGDLAAAERSFCRATGSLAAQRSRLGGSLESRNWFESETHSYFFDCLSALAERGRGEAAFHALESGKTRVFLEILAERDLRIQELPAELKAERARLDVEYDRILSRLSGMNPEDAGESAVLRARLEEIKAARGTFIARLRLQSPRFAALQAPEPLGLAEARRALDPGTTLLAYAVGPASSYLFVVSPPGEGRRGLEVHRLAIGRETLEKAIDRYLRLLTAPESDLTELEARAADLYGLLLGPAEKRLARARRILISADGPLHRLPWAALRRRDGYLAQWRPVHLIASMTMYEEIRRGRRPSGAPRTDPGTWRLVAFGDPRYGGRNLEPLPATRDEVREIATLFPGTEAYLGEEATEGRMKQAAPGADLLHIAGHGLIDERFPLDSALALTLPAQPREGRDNGLLQAWEIFENVRLDAHLVTLSACDSALGSEMGGEGLLGLTRAFQFAGARSVLASLWSVSDDSTARLMKRFYTYLRQGRTKDEALRAAHLDLISSTQGGFAHPYHWAGFALYGDWR